MHDDWGVLAERWRGIRSEVVEMSGTPVHVVRADGRSDGPVQLLVHGLGGSAANWLEVIPGLAALGPVVAPDLPGFGRTPPPHPAASRVRTNAGFVTALAERLGIRRAVVHGNSMGAMIAVLVADRAPEFVEALVLAGPALPGARGWTRRLARQTLVNFAPFTIPGMGRRVIRRMYRTRTTAELWQLNQTFVHADPACVGPELAEVGRDNLRFGAETPWRLDGLVTATESLLGELLRGRRLVGTLARLEAPALVVWGEQDRLIGRAMIDGVVSRRPDWEFHPLEGVGHLPQVEAPRRYLELVSAYLDAHGGTLAR